MVLSISVAGATDVGSACLRVDTLATLPLDDARDLVDWGAARALVTGAGYEVALAEVIRYQRAAAAHGDNEQWAGATMAALTALLDAGGESGLITAYTEELLGGIARVPPALQSRAYNLVGNAKSYIGDESGSIPAYLKAIETADSTAISALTSAYGNYALSLLVLGDTATAMSATRRCIALTNELEDPEDRAYNNVWDYVGLANLYFNSAELDSARANLARGLAAFRTFPPGHARYAKLGEFAWDVEYNFHMYDGDYAAAYQCIDSLRAVGASFVDITEAEWHADRGDFASAVHLLEELDGGNPHIERQRFDLLIEYADSLGDMRAVAKYAVAKAERAEEDKRNNQASFAALSAEHRETFEAQGAAKAERHAAEIALLRSRQRMWMALAIGLAAVAFAGYAARRYRRSDARTRTLSTIVSRQDEDLARANATLAEQLEALREFNHLLSHDLREPLRSISGFASIIARRIRAYPDVAEDFAFLTAGIAQLSALHEAVERYRKIREYAPLPQATRVVSAVRRVVTEVAAAAPDADIAVVTVLGDDSCLSVDAWCLEIVTRELLGNAVKFCRKAPAVTVEIAARGGHLTLAVDDDGIGLDTQYAELIFEIFKRLNRREEFAGAGMGLAIARVAAEHLSGTLALTRTAPGAGARFELRIPVTAIPKSPGTDPKPASRGARQTTIA